MMRFHWDPPKAKSNERKHRVAFEEACTVFADSEVLTIFDDSHSEVEERWASIGVSALGRVLVVIHTWPESGIGRDEQVRIVSARRANRRELSVYLERKR